MTRWRTVLVEVFRNFRTPTREFPRLEIGLG